MSRRTSALFLFVFLAIAALACGSDVVSTPGPDTQEIDEPLVVREGDVFTVDAFAAAGFKKSKEFSVETLPGAASIWYGFYKQRDVEIRFYEFHDLAVGPGVNSARQAIERSPNSNIGGGIITSTGNRTQYADFLVVGNAVILCQTDIAPCLELAGLAEAGG